MGTSETLQRLHAEAFSGALAKASLPELEVYSAALCHSHAYAEFGEREFPQICETVRIHLLRAHIQSLQSHITALDAKNTLLSWLVVALTVASLFGAGVQIWFAYKADKKAEAVSLPLATPQQTSPPLSASPSQAKPSTSGQLTKKAP